MTPSPYVFLPLFTLSTPRLNNAEAVIEPKHFQHTCYNPFINVFLTVVVFCDDASFRGPVMAFVQRKKQPNESIYFRRDPGMGGGSASSGREIILSMKIRSKCTHILIWRSRHARTGTTPESNALLRYGIEIPHIPNERIAFTYQAK